ncbi:phosphatidate cytidylyltransferase [Ferrovum sp.]|uniref:phosphatidate cytidylyltransferase n=1 Tax=Ferrovum sp. TaxID=2609467 RepID=UPI002623B0A0|nr:phosphatidate cytidylyltransferase [Ferrovum sp.]
MLRTRLLTAFVLLVVVGLSLFWAPPQVWAGLVTGVMIWAGWEWAGLAKVVFWQRCLYALLIPLLYRIGREASWQDLGMEGSLVFWIILVPLWMKQQWRISGLPLLAVGLLVLLPTGWSLTRLQHQGNLVLLALMAVLWISDSAAYFTGRLWGKHRLAPAISPGKTWEGVAGAGLAATVYGAIWWWLARTGSSSMTPLVNHLGWGWFLLVWGLVGLGILGDLFESWIKRCAGVKDSGNGLPGHGGVLDRIDALTATLPLAALSIHLLGGA